MIRLDDYVLSYGCLPYVEELEEQAAPGDKEKRVLDVLIVASKHEDKGARLYAVNFTLDDQDIYCLELSCIE